MKSRGNPVTFKQAQVAACTNNLPEIWTLPISLYYRELPQIAKFLATRRDRSLKATLLTQVSSETS